MASEKHVIASVLAGDTSEFRKLVEQYHQPVFRFARNLIGDEHEAEDIAQDVFLAALDRLASFDPKRAALLTWLLTWLLTITRNRCVNHLKRKRPLANGDVVANTQQANHHSDATRNEFWKQLDEALDGLPIDQKTAFVLAEIEGLTYAEIADIEQTTLGTVKSRIHRAKQRLQAVMAQKLGDES